MKRAFRILPFRVTLSLVNVSGRTWNDKLEDKEILRTNTEIIVFLSLLFSSYFSSSFLSLVLVDVFDYDTRMANGNLSSDTLE